MFNDAPQYILFGLWPSPDPVFESSFSWSLTSDEVTPSQYDGFLWPFSEFMIESSSQVDHRRMVTPSILLFVYLLYLVYVFNDNPGRQSRSCRMVHFTLKLLFKFILYCYLWYINLTDPGSFNDQALHILVLNFPSSVHAVWVLLKRAFGPSRSRHCQRLTTFRIKSCSKALLKTEFVERELKNRQLERKSSEVVRKVSSDTEWSVGKPGVAIGISNSEKSVHFETEKKPQTTKSLDLSDSEKEDKCTLVDLNTRAEGEQINKVIPDVNVNDISQHPAEVTNIEESSSTTDNKGLLSYAFAPAMFTLGMFVAPKTAKITVHAVTVGVMVYPMAVLAKNKIVSLFSRRRTD